MAGRVMPEYRAAVGADGRVLYGGWADPAKERADPPVPQYDVVPGLSPGQARVVLPREPAPGERWDAARQALRPPTAEERAADAARPARLPAEARAVLHAAAGFALGRDPRPEEAADIEARYARELAR